MPPRSTREAVLVAGFCLIPFLNFPRALVADRTLFLRDVGMVWAPQSEAVVQQVAKGEFPFFDGKRAFGQPLFADPRAEILYPPAWIHLVVSPDKSYAFFCALHVVIAAWGAARLSKRLIPGASFSAAATAGLAYGAGGPILSLVSHWHHLAAAAWMPWILERAEPRAGERTPWLSLSLLVALQVFAGSPDYLFTTFVLCILRAATRTETPAIERFRTFPPLLLGLAIGAVQLLPSLAFAREADRSASPIGWAISPMHVALTVETLVPVRAEMWPLRPEARSALGLDQQVWMFSHYLGLSVWALAGLGFSRAERGTRRFLTGCVLLGLVLAWGVTNDSLQNLIARVPLVAGLRFPTKHLAASSLGLALLAAHGVMPGDRREARSRVVFIVLLVAVFGFVAALFVWSTRPGIPFEFRAMLEPTIALLSVAVVGLSMSRAPLARFAPLMVAIDLLIAHLSLNPTTPATFFRDRPPLSASIPRGSRLYVSDYSIRLPHGSIRLPTGVPYHLERAPAGFTRAEAVTLAATWYLNPPSSGRLGYFGSFDLDVLDFYRAPLKRSIEAFVTSRDPLFVVRALQRGSVDYVVTMDPPDLWMALPLVAEERRFFGDTVRVYQVPSPWPRARLETSTGERDVGSATIASYADGHVRVNVEAPGISRLVLAVANDSGWRATIDGDLATILDNGLAFLAVPVPPGRHVVEFFYRPPHLVAGITVSATALAAAILLTGLSRRREAAHSQTRERPRDSDRKKEPARSTQVSSVNATPTTAVTGRNRNTTR